VADRAALGTLYEDNRDIWTPECTAASHIRWAELNGGMPR
jgi:hypothetical protein